MSHPTGVSVVIPTCGRPQFLEEALASVAAQVRPPAEVIVVEDGEGAGLEVTGGPLPLRVVRGPRRGPGAARNAGVAAARGELIAFLDDDDLWHPRKLALQVEWFARRPRLGLLGTGVARGRRPSWGRVDGGEKLQRVSPRALVKANRFATSSVLVRRHCLLECGGFAESLRLAQDWDLWLRIAATWEAALAPARLTYHRLHGGQRSANQVEMRRCEIEVLRLALGREEWAGRRGGVARRRLAWAEYRLGRALLREGRQREAAEVVRALARAHPLRALAWLGLSHCWLGTGIAGEGKG